MQRPDTWPLITDDVLKRIRAETTLPSPREQAANLVRWVGDQLRTTDPGQLFSFDGATAAAVIGAASDAGVLYIVNELERQGLISGAMRMGGFGDVRLTFLGWEEYEKLQRAHAEGPIAFMAMPFNQPDIDRLFTECFKPAAAQTGFELRRIDEKPEAGLIDNRLRVEIRRSRFLIADLTHENRGAYWEAGFAEGLGKPVIYSCEKARFEAEGTHFDTSHHHTVVWELDNLAAAAAQLKDTIRATLPDEAKLGDD